MTKKKAGYVEGAKELSGSGNMKKKNVKQTVEEKIQAEFKKAELEQVTAEMTVIGNPFLRSGVLLRINNVGKRFSGLWYIKEVRHVINGSGYLCDCQLQRNATNKVGDSGSAAGGTTNTSETTAPPVEAPPPIEEDVRSGGGSTEETVIIDGNTGEES